MDYFRYFNPSILTKDLYEANQAKTMEVIASWVNDSLIDLVDKKKKNPKNENPDKIIDIMEKIFEFNN